MDTQSDLVKILHKEHQKLIKSVRQQTEYLFNLIPNVTTALTAMLQLPPDKIHWVNFDIDDNIAILGVIIKFSPLEIPMFVQIFAPHTVDGLEGNEDDEITQMMRVGLPLELVDQSPMDIIQFFHDLATSNDEEKELVEESITNDTPTLAQSSVDAPFDVSGLSQEQIANFLLYQNHTQPTKH